MDIEGKHGDIVITSISYMVNNEYLRVIVLKGPKEKIIKLTESLKSISGIKYARLTTVGFENKN